MMLNQRDINHYMRLLHDTSGSFSSVKHLLSDIHLANYSYVRLYHDHRLLVIHQDLSVIEACLNRLDGEHLSMVKNFFQKYAWALWNDFDFEKNFKATSFMRYLRDRDLMNTCNIVFYERDYLEVHEFYGSHQHSHLHAFYTEQQALLHEFINYFKAKYLSVIEHLVPQSLILKPSQISHSSDRSVQLKNFGQQIKMDSKAITYQGQLHLLSTREHQMLQCFQKGWSIKSMAKLYQCSSRTIETYLDRVKHKLNVATRKSLFDIDMGRWNQNSC